MNMSSENYVADFCRLPNGVQCALPTVLRTVHLFKLFSQSCTTRNFSSRDGVELKAQIKRLEALTKLVTCAVLYEDTQIKSQWLIITT